MKKSLVSLIALSGAAALALSGCAAPPSASPSTPATSETPSASASAPESTPAGASDFTACMVSDAGGFDDKSFNETAHNGMMQAKDELGIKTNQIESTPRASTRATCSR